MFIVAILGLVVTILGLIVAIVSVITTRQMQPDPSSSGMAIPD